MIERALVLLESEMAKNRIELEKAFDNSVPAIYTDGDQLHQVLVNLIINAIQAMPGGGRLAVATRVAPAGKWGETAGEGSGSQSVELSVSDTGAGIAPEKRESIFNPFYTTKEKGSGLGLSIVYRIIKGLGGDVKLDTGIGKGTVFRIYLPLKTEKQDEDHTRS